jgi:inorganic pyrophosphatase
MYQVKKNDDKYFLYKDGKVISFLNDINYKENNIYNMVCEIPKNTLDKMEMSDLYNNPIIQDIENKKPRKFKYGRIPWNYGYIPQTLEDKNIICDKLNLPGDGDPIDVIDVSHIKSNIGDIIQIKILGIMPLIDNGEADWKIIGINVKDQLVNNITDLYPFQINKIYDWFINYKKHKEITNKIGMNQLIQDKELAIEIIQKCHNQWKNNQ